MREKINNMLYNYFGLMINSSDSSILKKVSGYVGEPIYIEFHGASGVGKTTLSNLLDKQKRKTWMDAFDYYLLNKKRLEKINPNDSEDYYQILAEFRTQDLINNDLSSIDKMRRFGYNVHILNFDIFISQNNENKTIVNDDGILHNFTNSFIKLYHENKDVFFDSIKNRNIIYCYSEPEVVTEQIIKRQKETGYLNLLHLHKSKSELLEKQKYLLDRKRTLIDYCYEGGIPILEIDTNDELDKNVRKIMEFIFNLQKISRKF